VNRSVVISTFVGLLVGAAAVAMTLSAGIGRGSNSDERIRQYLLSNPEIIPEAMEVLRSRKLGQTIEAHRADFETPFESAWAGSKNGDVTLVEFFDYACGFCRKSNADVQRLLKEDPKLKVVWREFPVLGDESLLAAEHSLSAAKQGKFADFHEAMFRSARPTASAVASALAAATVNPSVQKAEFQAEIAKNYELARLAGASGTPTFVVGNEVLHGAVGYDALKAAIHLARSGRRASY
jgi:protein-disulfide isomerase